MTIDTPEFRNLLRNYVEKAEESRYSSEAFEEELEARAALIAHIDAWRAAAPAPSLPKWIDGLKGSDPTIDDLIAYIERTAAPAQKERASRLFGGDMPIRREGATVYQLMHHGWRKGGEQFRNRVWFQVNVDAESGVSAETIAALVVDACNTFAPAQAEAPRKRGLPPEAHDAIKRAAVNREETADLPNGSTVFINYGDAEERYAASAETDCPYCGGSGHKDDVQAEAPSGEREAHDASERADIAARLRRVARLVGVENAIPEDDAALYGCTFAVLGMIASALDRAALAAQAGAVPVSPGLIDYFDRAIADATHPTGMHTNGPAMVRVDASRLARLLAAAKAAQPSQSLVEDVKRDAALEEAAKAVESFCAADEPLDQDEVNWVLRNRAARIRGMKSTAAIAAAPAEKGGA